VVFHHQLKFTSSKYNFNFRSWNTTKNWYLWSKTWSLFKEW